MGVKVSELWRILRKTLSETLHQDHNLFMINNKDLGYIYFFIKFFNTCIIQGTKNVINFSNQRYRCFWTLLFIIRKSILLIPKNVANFIIIYSLNVGAGMLYYFFSFYHFFSRS